MLAVAQVDGPNLIAVGDWTGRATPLHCVASGKVLLSSLAEREVLRIVRRGLLSYTERTITELEPLLEAAFLERTSEEWLAVLASPGLPFPPGDSVHDPLAAELGQ